jgi:aspartyl-tRNA(Asn)/glutamyl-tRNA(Gln) amidotransferase subunit C
VACEVLFVLQLATANCRISPDRFCQRIPVRVQPMSLEAKDVAKIAHLARLAITEQEMPAYTGSLAKIFTFVEQLNAAEVGDLEPMAHPLAGQVQRMRADEITEVDAHEKYQRNAPHVEAGLYLVPKVIE